MKNAQRAMTGEVEHLANREPLPDRTVAAGDTIEGVQICPVGDWPNSRGTQHCTEEALRNVVAAWEDDGGQDVLVDFEHNAEQGGTSDTSAAAWASNLRFEKGRGLVADFRMTDVGAEAVSNRRLRYLSVAWYVNRATREPTRITSVALTNKPNIPVAPVLNKAAPAMPPFLAELARRYDERMDKLANTSNYDESKHPRAEDGKWTSGGGGGAGGGGSGGGGPSPELKAKAAAAREKAAKLSPDAKKWASDKIFLGATDITHEGVASRINAAKAANHSGSEDKAVRVERLRALHAEAISLGFKYNLKTRQYE